MKFVEQNLEDLIYETYHKEGGAEKLRSRGLRIDGDLHRQVDLGSYGRVDLLEIKVNKNNNITITIYELKKEKIGINALLQAYRYRKGVEKHFGKLISLGIINPKALIDIDIVLIGSEIETNGDFVFLYNELNGVCIYTYEYTIDGLFFKEDSACYDITNAHLNKDTGQMFLNDIENQLKEYIDPQNNNPHDS